ncbi:MAG: alpha/beta hydrolase [Bacteroidia bacterium]|nr:MAG: alpha/beta hydrolase [Bacteroidia bacterium]
MNHFETRWKSSDGLDIFAQGWNPDTSPIGAVVCLVHGIGEHTFRYLNVAEAFTKEGYVLFGADLRGHGRSGGPRGHFPSIEAVLQDIDLLLEQARKLYPGLPLILYGNSMGGSLVLHYGLKRKPDVKGVIATSPALHNALEEQKVKVMVAKILGTLIPAVTIASGLDVNAISHDSEEVKSYYNDPLIHNKISLGFGKIMLNVSQWTLEHSSEFSLPLLLMHGKSDSIAFPSSSIEFAAPLNEICKLVLWEDAWHELHTEPIKKEVLNTMTGWIKKHLTE